MRKQILFILFLLVAITGYSLNNPNILVLNSYHSNMEWAESTINGIEKGLKQKLDSNYDLYIEYLDSKRNNFEGYSELFCDYLKNKYKHKEFKVIIANDNYALNFLENYKEELFPDVSVVLTGINFQRKYPDNYTSIQEEIDFCDNLQLIQQLHPEIKELYIISDDTRTGKLLKKEINRSLESVQCEIPFTFLTNYTFEALKDKVSQLDHGNVIFLTVFSKDRENRYFSYSEIIEELHAVSHIPIYGVWNFYMNKGLTGGKILSGYEHGKQAAYYASEIISGRDISELPVKKGPSTYKFDYKQLKEFGISKKQLPEGAVIINQPFDYITENRRTFIFIGVLLILLIITIIILIRYNRLKQKRINDQQKYLAEIRNSNEQLEEARKEAERANQLKTSFLANISHEIRTPLNAITGFSKLLVEGDTTTDSKTRKKYVNLIKVNSQILLNLINDIIDLSKIETGQLILNYTDFDLNRLIDDLEELISNELKKKNKSKIEVVVEKDIKEQNFFIRSDENRLRQVLINLIHNAIKYTYRGYIALGYKVKGEELLFYVKDTGIGVEDEDKNYIFDRFSQGNRVVKRQTEGTGIGLSLSREVIQRMKGKIWVESGSSKGAEFYFTIPLIDVADHKKNRVPGFGTKKLSDKYNWSGKRILIVEDSPISYELLIKLLNLTKAEFLHEEDGQSAIDRIEKDPSIDLVLMDIQLPVMDGYTTTEKIKEIRPELPVVAQTANAMSDDRRKCLDAGCDDYLAKPIDRHELLDKINRFFS